MNLFRIYLAFWIFSILGWIMEVIVCSTCDKKIQNRGFLLGPYCPIYGFGGLLMLLFLPFKDNIILCFSLCLVVCSILEYLTSYIMEKIFGIRWWDYSLDRFNVNGRICLRNSLAFGALGLLLTRYCYPILRNMLTSIPDKSLLIIVIIVFILTMLDLIISLKAMSKIKSLIDKNIKSFKNIDATEKIKKLIHDKLIKNNLKISYIEKRLFNTYSTVYKKINNYKHLFIIIGISFVIGLIFAIIFKNIEFIPILVSISVVLSFIITRVRYKK